jgi:hypothetical protein
MIWTLTKSISLSVLALGPLISELSVTNFVNFFPDIDPLLFRSDVTHIKNQPKKSKKAKQITRHVCGVV